ncbi:hypothetical protein IWX90DRAFT_162647 [Phyllosticta citrichinensis]|uniref:Uncharacterized protein n=1 Tax=Phyllosticta citrichinensis TaxID=1130410 RepID=A0ABR1Y0F8_9PEZI
MGFRSCVATAFSLFRVSALQSVSRSLSVSLCPACPSYSQPQPHLSRAGASALLLLLLLLLLPLLSVCTVPLVLPFFSLSRCSAAMRLRQLVLHSALHSVSQSASQPVSQSASQPVSQSKASIPSQAEPTGRLEYQYLPRYDHQQRSRAGAGDSLTHSLTHSLTTPPLTQPAQPQCPSSRQDRASSHWATGIPRRPRPLPGLRDG